MITRTPEKEIFQATGMTIREVMHQVRSHKVLMKAQMKEPPVISTGKKKRNRKKRTKYQNVQQNQKEKEGRRMWRKNFQRSHI